MDRTPEEFGRSKYSLMNRYMNKRGMFHENFRMSKTLDGGLIENNMNNDFEHNFEIAIKLGRGFIINGSLYIDSSIAKGFAALMIHGLNGELTPDYPSRGSSSLHGCIYDEGIYGN